MRRAVVSTSDALLFTGATVLDGTGQPPTPDTDVFVRGDSIEAVGAPAIAAADAAAANGVAVERLDVTGHTVMPGLIDAHCHITFGEPASNDELFFHRDQSTAAMVAAFNVRKLLLAGVTGFLDADCLWNLGPALRDCIEAGVVEGPRMTAGMNALLTAAGGTAGRLIPESGTAAYAHVVRGRDEMVRTTRDQIKHGADWVKIHVTGLLPNRSGELTVWTLDELRAVTDTAHDLGTPSIAHCRNATSTRLAAEAGVDLILHASFLDDAALEAVVASGCAVAPTFTFLANLVDHGHKVGAGTHPGGPVPRRDRGDRDQAPRRARRGRAAALRVRERLRASRRTATGTPARSSCWSRRWASPRSRRSAARPSTVRSHSAGTTAPSG